MKSKRYLIPAIILLIFSFLSFSSGFTMILLQMKEILFGIISMFVTGVVCLFISFYFFDKYRKENHLEPLPKEEVIIKPSNTKKMPSSKKNTSSIIEEDDEYDYDEEEWLDSLEEDNHCPDDDSLDDETIEDEGDDFDELNVLK